MTNADATLKTGSPDDLNKKHVFPISALSALGFRIALSTEPNQLATVCDTLDFSCIDMIAQSHLRMSYAQWRELTKEKQVNEVLKRLKKLSEKECIEFLEKNRFLPLMQFLEGAFGSSRQRQLLVEKIGYYARKSTGFSELIALSEQAKQIGKNVEINEQFRELWKGNVKDLLQAFLRKPVDHFDNLVHKSIVPLEEYLDFLVKNRLEELQANKEVRSFLWNSSIHDSRCNGM